MKNSSFPFLNCSLNTTEFTDISADQGPVADRGPPLPFGIFDHCMVSLDNGTYIIIGGVRNDVNSTEALIRNKVSIVTLEGESVSVKPGPPMVPNDFLLCGTFENDNGGIGIVTFSKLSSDGIGDVRFDLV